MKRSPGETPKSIDCAAVGSSVPLWDSEGSLEDVDGTD